MLDTEFDDFLDSDDDALFLEASNNLIEDLTSSETANTPHQNILLKNPKSIPCESSNALKKCSLQNKQNSVTSNYFKLKDVSLLQTSNDVSVPGESQSNSCDKAIKNITVTSSTTKSSNVSILSEKFITPESSYIDSRFTPGFTPKAKKRKLPGPAGLLEIFEDSEKTDPNKSHKMVTMDIDFQNIVSSQFTPEHLSLSSWQKLQAAVSSSSNLHSTAKYYSIKRVLQESSKKKLPKHMVVPVLCVLLKKILYKGSTSIFIFMDDTGEINGKIDTEVLTTYKEYMVEGVAFILKNVTFLCNMLLLKAETLVSVYHPDGSEKHLQTLDSVLENSEPLKPIKCECLKLTHQNMKEAMNNNNAFNNHRSGCISHNPSKPKNISNQTRTQNKSITSLNLKPSASKSNNVSTHVKNMRSDAFLENLLDGDNCIDEFDEFLGNLDEESFMQDL